MKYAKRSLSILLSVVLILSMFTIIPATSASAESVQVFARKWVEAANVTGDYFSFTDLYSNFIICRVNPDGGFDETNFSTTQSAVWNSTGDLSLTGNNKFVINTWNDGYGHSLGGYWDNDPGRQNDGNIYLSTENYNNGAAWYAYTWEIFTADSVDAAAPAYDDSEEHPYINGVKQHYVSGDRKFIAIEGTTGGNQNVKQVSDSELIVPYFDFVQEGNEQDGYIYKLKKCNAQDAEIVVPDTVPVTYPDNLFWGRDITVIAGGAFAGNTSLEKIEIGDSVNLIGSDIISNGSVPEGIIGAFDGCSNLREVRIGNTDASAFNRAEDQCFNGCTSLEYIKATTKSDLQNDYFNGIFTIAQDIMTESGNQLNICCYHDSSLSNWFANNSNVDLEYLDEGSPIHRFNENNPDYVKWTWSVSGNDVSAKVDLKCSICGFRTTVDAELEMVPDEQAASCTDPVQGHYKATAEYDSQTFSDDDGKAHTCTVPGKAHTPVTDGEYANLYNLETGSGLFEFRQVFKCSVCDTVYYGDWFTVNHFEGNASTCTEAGNYEYCTDSSNNYYRFLRAQGYGQLYTKVDGADDIISPPSHDLFERARKEATCTETGNIQYWECRDCHKYFSDAEGTTEITDHDSVIINATGHSLSHQEPNRAALNAAGNIEYWECTECGKRFSDAGGNTEIAPEDTVIPAYDAENIPYIDANGNSATAANVYSITSASTAITGDRITGDAEWYYVPQGDTVTINDACLWKGNICLIIGDGAILNVNKGVDMANGSLTIYGQENQSGILNVTAKPYSDSITVMGSVTVNGGVINTYGSTSLSVRARGGDITINRGFVTTDKDISSEIYNYNNVDHGGEIIINGGKTVVN